MKRRIFGGLAALAMIGIATAALATWPSSMTKANCDEATDDPEQCLYELGDDTDEFNTLLSHISSFWQGVLDDADAATSRTNLDAQQAVPSLTAETAPEPADEIYLYDSSAAAGRRMTLTNALTVIDGLTEDSGPDTAADYVVTYDADAGTSKKVKIENLGAVAAPDTAKTLTSGTTSDFTIAAGANRITVGLSGVDVSGSSARLLQLGDAGGVEVTGYDSNAGENGGDSQSTAGCLLERQTQAVMNGAAVLMRVTGNEWVMSGDTNDGGEWAALSCGKTTSGEVTTLRLTTVGGSDTFAAGAWNVIVE